MKVERTINGKTISIYIDGTAYQLLQGFQDAVQNYNTSIVLLVDGRSGMGKTTLAFQIAKILDPDFDLNKVHYDPEVFLQGNADKIGLANAKKGDCIVFDEAMLLSSRSAMSEINKMTIMAMSMIRSKQIFVIFCVNAIFDLDRNLSISRGDCLLHVYGPNLISRGRYAAFFKSLDHIDRLKSLYLNGKKYYSYAKPKANFIGKFYDNFIVDSKLYEQQKQEGVNKFLNSGKAERWTKALVTRNKIISHLINNKIMSVKELSEVSGLKHAILSTIAQGKKED